MFIFNVSLLPLCVSSALTKAVLAALEACPKDTDVQRWGCQALVHIFSDPMVATTYQEPGVAAIVRALALLQDVEKALTVMGRGRRTVIGGRRPSAPVANDLTIRTKWQSAMRKVNKRERCGGMQGSCLGRWNAHDIKLEHTL